MPTQQLTVAECINPGDFVEVDLENSNQTKSSVVERKEEGGVGEMMGEVEDEEEEDEGENKNTSDDTFTERIVLQNGTGEAYNSAQRGKPPVLGEQGGQGRQMVHPHLVAIMQGIEDDLVVSHYSTRHIMASGSMGGNVAQKNIKKKKRLKAGRGPTVLEDRLGPKAHDTVRLREHGGKRRHTHATLAAQLYRKFHLDKAAESTGVVAEMVPEVVAEAAVAMTDRRRQRTLAQLPEGSAAPLMDPTDGDEAADETADIISGTTRGTTSVALRFAEAAHITPSPSPPPEKRHVTLHRVRDELGLLQSCWGIKLVNGTSYRGVEETGIFIHSVKPGSPAAAAADSFLERGWRITSVDGVPLTSMKAIKQALANGLLSTTLGLELPYLPPQRPGRRVHTTQQDETTKRRTQLRKLQRAGTMSGRIMRLAGRRLANSAATQFWRDFFNHWLRVHPILMIFKKSRDLYGCRGYSSSSCFFIRLRVSFSSVRRRPLVLDRIQPIKKTLART